MKYLNKNTYDLRLSAWSKWKYEVSMLIK